MSSLQMVLPSPSPLLSWVQYWEAQGVSPVPKLFKLHQIDHVSSTNTYLWERLRLEERRETEHQDACATVAIARSQSTGRGQWGRRWHSPVGGLYLSAALPALPAADGGALMLSCAWGVAAALRQFGVPVRLKWPNDFVVGRRKLGGMLIETRLVGPMITQAVVGIGINWCNVVPAGGVSIAELESPPVGKPLQISIETLAAAVLTGVALGNGRQRHQGVDSILADYETLMTHLGQTVIISSQGRRVRGRVQGVAATGQLRICLDQGMDRSSSSQTPSNQITAIGQPKPARSVEITASTGSVCLSYDTIGE